eukprot:3679945-Pleurochrysis_carterae.AAC.1
MSLVGGADLNGTASGDPTNLRSERPPYRGSPTGLSLSERASTGFTARFLAERIAATSLCSFAYWHLA